jgi:GNAT superfamily N-acetyltransferase
LNNEVDIAIRPATRADAAQVHAMLLKLALVMGAERKIRNTVRDIREALSGDPPAIHAFIADRNGKPVGLAIVFLNFSTWRGSPGVYVQDIFVSASARGTGLGKRLLQAVAAWGQERGADHLRLSVEPGNATARAFYANAGLRLRDDELIYAATGESFLNLANTS